MTRRRSGRVAPAALAVLLLAACGGGSGDLRVGGNDQPPAEAESATIPPEEVTPEEGATPEPTEEPSAPTGDLTPPGSELALGETATLPVVDSLGGGEGVVELTVTEIRPGDRADLGEEAASYGPDAAPAYVFYEATVVSGAADLAGWSPSSDLLGQQPDGLPSGLLITGGAVGPCEKAEVPEGAADGQVLEGCFSALSLSGVPVTGVTYSARGTEYEAGSGSVSWTG
ncbi:hypothetical protein [Nocardioides nanhaiensis]|uniref:Uncharacterized protein n=1 Tax=Nocardioides nanhaiensis TaxID=1476871 RepID=A0ABP8VRQ6_9ACTN